MSRPVTVSQILVYIDEHRAHFGYPPAAIGLTGGERRRLNEEIKWPGGGYRLCAAELEAFMGVHIIALPCPECGDVPCT